MNDEKKEGIEKEVAKRTEQTTDLKEFVPIAQSYLETRNKDLEFKKEYRLKKLEVDERADQREVQLEDITLRSTLLVPACALQKRLLFSI